MGRATITGGGDEGLYTAQVVFNTESAKKTVEAINAEIEEIDEEIGLLEEKIEEVEGELRDKTDAREALHNDYNVAAESARLKNEEAVTHPEYDTFEGKEGAAPNKWIQDQEWFKELRDRISIGDLLDAYFEETFGRPYEGTPALSVEFAEESAKEEVTDAGKAAPPPSDEEMKEKFGDFLAALAEEHAVQNVLLALEKMVAMREYQKEALEKRKEKLQAAADELDERSMWCADLTEDLSGGVDTIEVTGAPTQILIGPEGTNALTADGGVGKLTNIITMSAAQCGLAWALLPGWQKWRPTYRVGSIHDIDYDADTASVTLDEAVSVAQGLAVNQTTELTGIEVDYMECDAEAFESGDRVVVEFAGQLWEQGPKVIGFESHPQVCHGYAGVIGSTEGYSSLGDQWIFEWNHGDASGTASSTATLSSTPPEDKKHYNSAYAKGARVKFGAKWKYPFDFQDKTKFSMAVAFEMVLYDKNGNKTGTIPIEIGYGESGFAPEDKTVANTGMKIFECEYDETVGSGPFEVVNHDINCPWELQHQVVATVLFSDYDRDVTNLNAIPTYNHYYLHRYYLWVDDDYPVGLSAGSSEFVSTGCDCEKVASCKSPGAECPNEFMVHLQDYLDLYDPCGEVEEADEGFLYIEQSWSMSGVVDDNGILLDDSTAELTVGDKTIPIGPWPLKNATAGEARLTSVAPLEGVHHVGFTVRSLNTDSGQAAAITTEYDGGAKRLYTGSVGRVEFYGLIDATRLEETEE